MKASTGTAKFYLGSLALLTLALLVFVQAAFNLVPFNINPDQPDQILLLYSLSTFIFLVLIIFGFVLLRSLFKVWVEHKAQKPGAKFKTKLVLSLISLTLVQATVLFLFAFGLVNRSIDKWFSVPVDKIFLTTEEISSKWAEDDLKVARGILSQIAVHPPQDLENARINFGLEAIVLMDRGGKILNGTPGSQNYEPIFLEYLNSIDDSIPTPLHEIGGLMVGLKSSLSNPNIIVATVFDAPRHFQELTATIAEERTSYNELVQNRRFYRDTYVYILVLMTILVLFAAVWTGLFFSKRITIPIEALSGATKEISSGNLNHRVQVEAKDELGLLVGLFNDMADQLQLTTGQLDERRRYVEIILEAIPTGVVSINEQLHITKINRAARTMFSIENPDTLDKVFAPDDLERIRELLRVSAQEGTLTRELTLITADRIVHSAVTASLLTGGGFVLVVEDLTEVVKAQKATAWREVARRLAHEIKNPLTPIQLSAERIVRNARKLPKTESRIQEVMGECVNTIVGEVASLKELVNEFGRVARLPAISRKPTEIKNLIEKTLTLYDGRFNGTVVKSSLPDDLPLILMDGQQIKRVLINLIDNALEAMAAETTKELNIECGLVRDDTTARLTVTDTGPGIEPEDQQRLFAPYFSTRKNGTGLGLAIASRIVADHGGYIGAEPNSPHGTKFIVELPICQES